MENLLTKSIGSIVADDYRAAKIFRKYDIDFCCKGNRSIQDVIKQIPLPVAAIIEELTSLNAEVEGADPAYKTWTPDQLIEHILIKHHKYVEEHLVILSEYLDKVCTVHGHHHTELHEISDHFYAMAEALTAHMKKEELILFPYIRQIYACRLKGEQAPAPQFGTVENPVNMMRQEHDTEGERLRKMSALSNNFTPPEEACNTYRVLYALLAEFEQDLHKHIHLENNILFPMAIEMEKR